MANLPLRRLGDIGIITDASTFDLPPNALSQGSNIRCQNGRIYRSPVFKSVLTPTTAPIPVFTWFYAAPGQTDSIGIAGRDGKLYFYKNAVEDEVTPTAGFTPVSNDLVHTACTLANVNYINRASAVPMYYGSASTDFVLLPNWNATWRCRSLRSFKDQLVAIDVTEGATNYPSRVRTSDITTINNYPGSWDSTDPTNSAYKNDVSECTTGLLDGLPLRDVFILYSSDQTYLMEFTQDNDIFRIRKLFDGVGIINTNCVVEIEGKHYVFGKKDIYVHDGVSFQSILEGKNSKYVYGSLLQSHSQFFFVVYNPLYREVMFCYFSGDAEVAFGGVAYCNKAAVYNIDGGQWTFRDLPNATAATRAALSLSLTYAAATALYSDASGSYASLDDTADKGLLFTSPSDVTGALTASRLYGYDDASFGRLSASISTEATKTSWVQRVGIDLDETQLPLNTYKVLRTIYPQAANLGGTSNISFKFAGSLYPDPDLTISWGTLQAFDPATQYKVDVKKGGRYLSWYMENSSLYGHELSGFDSDVVMIGKK